MLINSTKSHIKMTENFSTTEIFASVKCSPKNLDSLTDMRNWSFSDEPLHKKQSGPLLFARKRFIKKEVIVLISSRLCFRIRCAPLYTRHINRGRKLSLAVFLRVSCRPNFVAEIDFFGFSSEICPSASPLIRNWSSTCVLPFSHCPIKGSNARQIGVFCNWNNIFMRIANLNR